MKIAIVKLSALGDIIHTMIVLQFIKKYYPNSIIDWFVEESFRGVLEDNPHINNIHTVKFKLAKQRKSVILFLSECIRLRRVERYDLVIDFQNLLKSAIVSRLVPSDKTIGLDKKSSREKVAAWFYTHNYRVDCSENVIKRNSFIVARALNMRISEKDIINKHSFLYFRNKYTGHCFSKILPNVILVPGASFESKMYPMKKYALLTKQVNANFIVLWGNEKEKRIAKQIQHVSPHVTIAEKLSLQELKAFISQADLLIGGDTGPTHMAWALNIPSITLFGSTPGYRNTYVTNINRIIESASSVNPYKIDKNDYSINDIRVIHIVKMLSNLLGQSNK